MEFFPRRGGKTEEKDADIKTECVLVVRSLDPPGAGFLRGIIHVK
jgi:hypothetical protein